MRHKYTKRPITKAEELPPRQQKSGKGQRGYLPRGSIVCTVVDCNRRVVARELCNLHWHRWRTHGDTAVVVVRVADPVAARQRRIERQQRISAIAREQARNYTKGIREQTRCAHCNAPMQDWHNPEHVFAPTRRISRMTSIGCAIAAIQAEIDLCTPLCRRCHMVEDNRLQQLAVAHAEWLTRRQTHQKGS